MFAYGAISTQLNLQVEIWKESVMTPLGTSSALEKSERDNGEYHGNMEDSMAELDGQSDTMLGTLREFKRGQPDKKPDVQAGEETAATGQCR